MTIDDLRSRTTVTVTEAAEVLGCSRSQAFELVKRGEIPAIRLGRLRRVPALWLLEQLGADPSPSAASTKEAIRLRATG